MKQDVNDMKYFTSFGTVTKACKELLSKWEFAINSTKEEMAQN